MILGLKIKGMETAKKEDSEFLLMSVCLSLSQCSHHCLCLLLSPSVSVCISGELVASGQHRLQCAWPAGPAAAWQGTTLITALFVCCLPARPVCPAPPQCCPLHNHPAGNPPLAPLQEQQQCRCPLVCHGCWGFYVWFICVFFVCW